MSDIDHFGDIMYAMLTEPEWFEEQLAIAERVIKEKGLDKEVDVDTWAEKLAGDVCNADD